MIDLENLQAFISTADGDTLNAVDSAVKQARAALRAARDAALPEFPTLISLDVPGHRAGNIVQVSKTRALELLAAGSHRIAAPDELGQ